MSIRGLVASKSIKLHVTGGRHAGAVLDATEEPQVIGCSLDSDLVLTDPGVCPRHLHTHKDRQGIELEAIDGPALVNGVSLQKGQKTHAKFPVSIIIGDAKVEFIKNSAGQGRIGFLSIMAAVALLGLVFTLGLSSGAAERDPSGKVKADGGAAGLSLINIAPKTATASERAATLSVDTNAAATALQEYLISQDLTGIDVKGGAGRVIAAGSIVPGQLGGWRSVEMWFDEHYGPNIMLESSVSVSTAKAAKTPITIQSAWLGTMPYVIDGEGNKYFEGATLKEGWVLEKIEDGKVLVTKSHQPLILRY